MSTSTLALTGKIADYFAAHAFREPAILAELRVETAKLGGESNMQIAPEQGAFMGLVAGMMEAREIIEIGTFTGYSSLAMALAGSARVTAVDVSEQWTAVAQRFWAKAGIADRMTLRLDGGNAAMADLLKAGKSGHFDLAFIDADKENYDLYYEGCLQLVRKGGVMLFDNVLWNGAVADSKQNDADTVALRKLNDKIATDHRVDFCMVPIGDGLTMARKK